MLMDMELFTRVNEVIAELQEQFYEMYKVPLDMVVMQDDKYRNTEFETITYGLGNSCGMKSKNYYFNAINSDDDRVETYHNEPVSFYEHNGERCMEYRIDVNTMRRTIRVFQISYGYKDEVIYNTINEFTIGDSKFIKKVLPPLTT